MSVVSSAVSAATATPIELDFGDTTQSLFGASSLTMSYTDVATGINTTINATITADSTYNANNRPNNGSVSGNVRINMRSNHAEVFTLIWWDSTVGDGFETVYDPGTN